MYDERSYDTRSYDTRSYFFGILTDAWSKTVTGVSAVAKVLQDYTVLILRL